MNKPFFTPDIIRNLPRLIEQYATIDDLAFAIGCTVNTLRSRCSEFGVSLHKYSKHAENGNTVRLNSVVVPRGVARVIRYKAAQLGADERTLISCMLCKIAEDDLFAAVLDGAEVI